LSSSTHVLFAVGEFVKAFGIKGEIVVRPMTDSVQRLGKLRRVFVGQTAATAQETTVEFVRVERRGVRVKLSHVDDRIAAERIVGALLFVDETDRTRLPKGRYFIHDVVGLTVIDEGHRTIGTVRDVLRMPAHDVYVVRSGDHEVMVPAVKQFIKSIDLKTKTMRVRLIEGMTE
jgi:16S rRNA processing protein RimM